MNETVSKERARKGWYWPLLLGALMAVVIGANLTLMVVATSDPSFAVEEDYYRKSLDWDRSREQQRVNVALGWNFDLQVAHEQAPDGTVSVAARVTGPDGDPIDGLKVGLEMFHNARASDILRATLRPEGDGRYETALPLGLQGRWELRFIATGDGRRFTHTSVEELYWQ